MLLVNYLIEPHNNISNLLTCLKAWLVLPIHRRLRLSKTARRTDAAGIVIVFLVHLAVRLSASLISSEDHCIADADISKEKLIACLKSHLVIVFVGFVAIGTQMLNV